MKNIGPLDFLRYGAGIALTLAGAYFWIEGTAAFLANRFAIILLVIGFVILANRTFDLSDQSGRSNVNWPGYAMFVAATVIMAVIHIVALRTDFASGVGGAIGILVLSLMLVAFRFLISYVSRLTQRR